MKRSGEALNNMREITRVFLVGCPRSGTTLLQKLLSERFGLFTLPETHIFSRAVGRLQPRAFGHAKNQETSLRSLTSCIRVSCGVSTAQPWGDFAPALESSGYAELMHSLPTGRRRIATIARMFGETLDQAAISAGSQGWIEKTPDHVHYLDFIHRLMPDAWVVHIVRDGRDTVASILDAAKRYERPWRAIYPTIERAVERWNKSMEDSALHAEHPKAIVVPYSLLVRSPDGVVNSVGHFPGLSAAKLGLSDNPGSSLTLPREIWKSGAVKGVVSVPENKWLTVLNESEREAVDRLLRPIPHILQSRLDMFAATCNTPKFVNSVRQSHG